MSPQCKLAVSITNEIFQMKFYVVVRVFMVFMLVVVYGALSLRIFLLSFAQKCHHCWQQQQQAYSPG